MVKASAVGILKLDRLVEFVEAHPSCYMPPRSKASLKEMREFGSLCREITEVIPAQRGVYLWGAYDPKGLWHNIYLGLAGFGKTACLRARINEELRDERCLFWSKVVDVLSINDRNGRFRVRALRKKEATHIVWVAMEHLQNKEVHDLESDLIEALNPEANLSRPSPPCHLRRESNGVFNRLRRVIHENRPA